MKARCRGEFFNAGSAVGFVVSWWLRAAGMG
jgi:hypothetical protein